MKHLLHKAHPPAQNLTPPHPAAATAAQQRPFYQLLTVFFGHLKKTRPERENRKSSFFVIYS
jgi:hypothetical protein